VGLCSFVCKGVVIEVRGKLALSVLRLAVPVYICRQIYMATFHLRRGVRVTEKSDKFLRKAF